MPPQIRHLHKMSIAMATVVGLLSGVKSHVGFEMMVPRESFLAFRTFERFLTRVRSFVILKYVLVAERSRTNVACKTFVTRWIFCGRWWWMIDGPVRLR